MTIETVQDVEVTGVDYSDTSLESKNDPSIFVTVPKWLKARSFRFWVLSLTGTMTVATLGSVFTALNLKPSKNGLGSQYGTDMSLSMNTPATLGGITKDTPTEELIGRLQDGSSKYEVMLNGRTSEIFKEMYALEANRLYESAVKEELSGKFDSTDPLHLMDLGQCPKEVGRIRVCVLFRYSSEGISEYRKGVESGSLDQATKGFNRFVSAQMALNPPSMQQPNFTRSVDGMTELYKANYELIKVIPPSSFKVPFGLNVEAPSKSQLKAAVQSKAQNKVPAINKK